MYDGEEPRQHPCDDEHTADGAEEVVPLVALAGEGREELRRLLLRTATVVHDAEVEARQRHERTDSAEDDDDPAPEVGTRADVGEVDPVRDSASPRPEALAAGGLLQHVARHARDVDLMPGASGEKEAIEGEVLREAREGRPLVKLRDGVDALDALPPAGGDGLQIRSVELERAQAVAVEGQLTALPLYGEDDETRTAVGIRPARDLQALQRHGVELEGGEEGVQAICRGQALGQTGAVLQLLVHRVLGIGVVDKDKA